MRVAASSPMPKYFEFEVTLLEIEPRIWRRFLLRQNASFKTLHVAIQKACGWWNYHLYVFRAEMEYDESSDIAGVPTGVYLDKPTPDAARVKVMSYLGGDRIDRCYYLYDFGDDWWHEVRLRRIVARPEKFTRRLIGGARAFPHEDSGGIPGYEDCVKAALHQDKGLDDPDRLRTWLEGWQPEGFDLKKAKKAFDR